MSLFVLTKSTRMPCSSLSAQNMPFGTLPTLVKCLWWVGALGNLEKPTSETFPASQLIFCLSESSSIACCCLPDSANSLACSKLCSVPHWCFQSVLRLGLLPALCSTSSPHLWLPSLHCTSRSQVTRKRMDSFKFDSSEVPKVRHSANIFGFAHKTENCRCQTLSAYIPHAFPKQQCH